MVKVRFAPSPTGYVHIGNIRIAIFNWLYALKHKGTFVLRYDDTDQIRSKEEFIKGIAKDLEWLQIYPDEIAFQSKRFDRYDEIVKCLKEKGLLYPCYETGEELDRRRKILLSRKLPPIYGREALKITEAEKQAYEAEGRRPHWRFLLPNFETSPFVTRRTEIVWQDAVRGSQVIDLASLSDPVLIREDGTYLYTLPSVIDDIDMKITHIIRGDDHVTNTGAQLAIFDALNAVRPTFGHINLLTTASGEGLSKRKGDLSIRSLREDGFEPMAIACLASLIGTSENAQAYNNMKDLLEVFDLSFTSRSAAKFDISDLLRLNKDLVHKLSFSDAQAKLKNLGIRGKQVGKFWHAIQGNIERVNEAKYWWDIIHNENLVLSRIKENIEDMEVLKYAEESLPPAPWNENSWKEWTNTLKEKTGRKGKQLFKPLRLALTGQENGPELALLMPLMPEQLLRKRLQMAQSSDT